MLASEKKGIKGRSLLLDIDHFDYIKGMPTEYMHVVALGGVKRLLEVTFSVGENRQRNIKTPLSSPDTFNELMKDVKVFKESSRRIRKLDMSVMKAQELRNVILFFFPVICETLTDKESKVWEMLAFMIRACVLPENEYENVNVNQIKFCQNNFYLLFEQLFGPKNCTYSIHIVAGHLSTIRESGPFTETSAFKFEAFYAELRQAFQAGTVSVLKQMFQNVILKRMLSTPHVCQEKIYYKEKDTALECNSLVYVYKEKRHVIYKINSIDKDRFSCNQMGNHDVSLPNTGMLNWSTVGVYRKGPLSHEEVIIDRKEIAGKVIRVKQYLITCPVEVLREK